MKSKVLLHYCQEVSLSGCVAAKLDTFKIKAPCFPILHLATHGCFPPQGCPDLQLPANTILFSDRNLNIADAALLGLKNTNLVVLSACQTAVQANSSGKNLLALPIYLNALLSL